MLKQTEFSFSSTCDIFESLELFMGRLQGSSLDEMVENINRLREIIHNHSPFKAEPVDFVKWRKADNVVANDYNPNTVAPPEMELLRHSISEDGYTQPIVTWLAEDLNEVIDGFHRHRVGKECDEVAERIKGYLPVVEANSEREGRNDRIASTIRHNRARGKHQIDSMSDIVIELKNRNWTNSRICRELGMDEDEVLRLCQITGLSELFKDDDFSRSWDIEDSEISEHEALTDEVTEQEKVTHGFRTVNTSDANRVFHTYHKWECHKAGFYASSFNGKTKNECEQAYAEFLGDTERFSSALEHVISEWKYSCEHYLTNASMNRIAWLGQAAMCYATGIPSTFRGGFYLLSDEQQKEANSVALEALNKWLNANGMEPVSADAADPDRQSNIY